MKSSKKDMLDNTTYFSKTFKRFAMIMAFLLLLTFVNPGVFAEAINSTRSIIPKTETVANVSDNDPSTQPIITANIPENADVGTKITSKLDIQNFDNFKNFTISFNGTDLTVASGEISFTVTDEYQNVLNIKAFDNGGNYVEKVYHINGNETEKVEIEKTEQAPVKVAPRVSTMSTFAPTLSVSTPKTNTVVTAPTDIVGTVGGTGVARYTLEYATTTEANLPASSEKKYYKFAEGTGLITNGVLGTFDTTNLYNGFYSIRLTVYGESTSQSTEITACVEGNMKVGNFSTEFIDMDIPILHFPLTVKRGYDSRNKEVKGDFGYGWSIDLLKATLTESGVPGKGWGQQKSGGMFASYVLTETYPHEVAIDWGNGITEKFKMTPNPSSQQMQPIQWFTGINYAGIGTRSKLVALDGGSDFFIQNSTILNYDAEIYNPTRYKLTKPDGTIYIFSERGGIEEVTDPMGNKITIGKDSVTHSDGTSIKFERDAEKRITKISESDKFIKYDYDAAGDLVKTANELGDTIEYTYKNHYLTEIKDSKKAHNSRNEYGENGKLIAIIDAAGNRIALDLDIANRTQTLTDRNGNTTVYEFDNRGNTTRIIDALGNATRHTYDAKDNLLSTTDAVGNTTSYVYNTYGEITTVTNPLGKKSVATYETKGLINGITADGIKTATITYNTFGQITSSVDGVSAKTTYGYDESAQLSSISDTIGTLKSYNYDNKGNLTSVTNSAGFTEFYTYDEEGSPLSKTYTVDTKNGKETVTENYQYDVSGNLVKVIYHDGTFVTLTYDLNSNMASKTEPNGDKTMYEYDLFNSVKKIIYPDLTTETFEYDKEGKTLKSVDRNGQISVMTYDAVGNLKTKTNSNGVVESYIYDAKNRLIAQSDTDGMSMSYTYDALDKNTSVTSDGLTMQFIYNGIGQLTSLKDANGFETKYLYDKNGNMTRTTYPNTAYVANVYDLRNRKTQTTDQNGYITKYTYDSADNLISVTDAMGSVWSYTYTKMGNIETVTDPKSNITAYEYDKLGREIKKTDAAGGTTLTAYDDANNTVTITDIAGRKSVQKFDDYGKILTETVGGVTTSYTYNAKDLLEKVSEVSASGSKLTSYIYNTDGQLTKVTNPDGTYVSYEYDKAGNKTKIVTAYGSTSYVYDISGRLSKVIDQDGQETLYVYNVNGSLASRTYSNGVKTEYFYSNINALTGIKVTDKNGAITEEYVYTVGKAGERLTVSERSGRKVSYTYDKNYRLTKETTTENAKTVTNTYIYDKLSNIASKNEGGKVIPYTYSALGQVLTEGTVAYSYDNAGNRIRETGEGKNNLYEYDVKNRMVKANISDNGTTSVETYEYDYQQNRISKTTDGVKTKYLLDTNNWITHVIAELSTSNVLQVFYTRGEDTLIHQKRGSAMGGVKSYFVFDGQNSVRALMTENGVKTDTYTYDAYGKLTARTGTTENSFLYQGEQFDKSTGLYYLRARYMNPTNGTFTTMDTYQGQREDPVSLHKYLYANANPVSNSDPTGYFALGGGITAGGIISDVEARHNTAVMKIFAKLMVKLNAIALFLTTYKMQVMLITLLVMFATGVAGSQMPNDIQREIEKVKLFLDSVFEGLLASLVSTVRIEPYNHKLEWHHIVARDAPSAKRARDILKRDDVAISIDGPINVIWIKTGYHKRLHALGNAYYFPVNVAISAAYSAAPSFGKRIAVESALVGIAAAIYANSFMSIT